MCAILDTNVAHEVFGADRPLAGKRFFQWVNGGKGRLVIGGKLYEELLMSSPAFRAWAKEAVSSGRMRVENYSQVEQRAEELEIQGECRSDDTHIIALAQISRARLLYSNDEDLRRDFVTRSLIGNPQGKVYSTRRIGSRRGRVHSVRRAGEFTSTHKRLLENRKLCMQ